MKQQSFSNADKPAEINTEVDNKLPDAHRLAAPVTLIKGYLNLEQQNALLKEAQGYPFESPEIEVYGKRHRIPRSQAWFGDMGCDTKYSGLMVKALPWPKYADRLRLKLKRDFNLESNGVLVNRYVDGKESMGWHCDNEPEFSAGSDIASITLGATRDFIIRDKVTLNKHTFALQSGDLLLMHWPMQDRWDHALPKRMKVTESRINYTFRRVISGYFD
ncbi:DNA-N1-methyladenine dioxygenase [Shewanella psychrophila]|uniref:DNA-N1-methyladenine dioxygenase n=1 Tax=Shewanella psychrophila TaxID=225848 RepID=A0A1S6HVA7_9GAMM|nr:alpha-ketoglutarate-dependent dioxygenase AlkB [Shewanella psychrophila]AQS39412.1 DNA-N1-methyladenine dioxygenase [Shewanella psychrophila]